MERGKLPPALWSSRCRFDDVRYSFDWLKGKKGETKTAAVYSILEKKDYNEKVDCTGQYVLVILLQFFVKICTKHDKIIFCVTFKYLSTNNCLIFISNRCTVPRHWPSTDNNKVINSNHTINSNQWVMQIVIGTTIKKKLAVQSLLWKTPWTTMLFNPIS